MNKQQIIRKLISRKFHAMLLAFLTALLVLIGLDAALITEVVAIIGAFLTMIAYILGESKIDAERIRWGDEDKENRSKNYDNL